MSHVSDLCTVNILDNATSVIGRLFRCVIVLLKIYMFRNVMLCCWLNISLRFGGTTTLRKIGVLAQ